MYCVSQQIQYPDGDRVVEVSIGGCGYANPGAVGDLESFNFALDAAKRAIEVALKWVDEDGVAADVGYGNTMGMTMPFDACTHDELMAWAEERDSKLPVCEHCGEKFAKDGVEIYGYNFCSGDHATEWKTELDTYPYWAICAIGTAPALDAWDVDDNDAEDILIHSGLSCWEVRRLPEGESEQEKAEWLLNHKDIQRAIADKSTDWLAEEEEIESNPDFAEFMSC